MLNNHDSDFAKAADIIIQEGRGCSCRYRAICKQPGEMWCKYITRVNANSKTLQYRDLNISPCVYRELPGCCWILSSVEKFASDYLKKLDIKQAPVPLDLIKCFDENRETEVALLPLKYVHGATWLFNDEWIVQINQNDSPQAQRFTLFHEAFHIACRSVNKEFKRKDRRQMPFRDALADHFSTCLLMPKEWIEDYWSMTRDIHNMSNIFDVTPAAISHRLNQLGLSYPSNR